MSIENRLLTVYFDRFFGPLPSIPGGGGVGGAGALLPNRACAGVGSITAATTAATTAPCLHAHSECAVHHRC
jgi:hypothetical protein